MLEAAEALVLQGEVAVVVDVKMTKTVEEGFPGCVCVVEVAGVE